MVQKMDIGHKGDRQLIYKRKFRWIMQLSAAGNGSAGASGEMWYAKTSARPQLTVEETEVHHLHERWMISGKPTWESITITILDAKNADGNDSETALHAWLNTVFAFDNDSGASQFTMGDCDEEYKRQITLTMLDGSGNTMETWLLHNCWPQSTNFGDLDYSSSDTADIEVTVRFDRAFWSKS